MLRYATSIVSRLFSTLEFIATRFCQDFCHKYQDTVQFQKRMSKHYATQISREKSCEKNYINKRLIKSDI